MSVGLLVVMPMCCCVEHLACKRITALRVQNNQAVLVSTASMQLPTRPFSPTLPTSNLQVNGQQEFGVRQPRLPFACSLCIHICSLGLLSSCFLWPGKSLRTRNASNAHFGQVRGPILLMGSSSSRALGCLDSCTPCSGSWLGYCARLAATLSAFDWGVLECEVLPDCIAVALVHCRG